MRQAVTFHCSVCHSAIHQQVLLQGRGITVRFCCWRCLVSWVVRGG
jgi:hypothetical protein